MSGLLEPNNEGTVCCVCKRAIVPFVDARHCIYEGKEARHYHCTASAKMADAQKGLRDALDTAQGALDKLRDRSRK